MRLRIDREWGAAIRLFPRDVLKRGAIARPST
jgi:hypothetical protein